MTRPYIVPITALGSLTTAPFLQLATPAATVIEILEIVLGQSGSTTSAQTVVSLMRRSTASTLPTGTAPVALVEGDPASLLTGTTTTNAIGIATVTGTAGNALHRFPFNVLNGLWYVPVPEARIRIKPSSFWTMQFPNAPPAVTWEGHVIFQELV